MDVEDRQDADDLCLAAITACRVLQRMARDRPNAPATEVVDEIATSISQSAARAGRSPKTLMSGPSWSTWGDSQASTPPKAVARNRLAELRQAYVQIYQALRNNDMLKDSEG